MSGIKGFFVALAVFAASAPESSFADIVKYMDENGTVHFTDSGGPWPFEILKRIPSAPKREVRAAVYEENRDRFLPVINAAAEAYGLDPHLVRCVIEQESAFNPRAISAKGAVGLMQLMPRTANIYKVKNIYDPYENIHGGTRYLKYLLKKYRGDVKLALAAYNAGEEAVRRYSGVPPYQETQQYVEKILAQYGKRYEMPRESVREHKKIYRYEREDGSVLLTDTPRTANDYD
ncbi:MAG: lytic transglycosylase domain-containing protein [Nitrospinae bacterium]|nr:lytic transglycosylase domain-containing protein [Nitrospinota bacterium]